MAAFLFVHSVNNHPLDLSPATKARVFDTLQERSPGRIREESSRSFFAASTGHDGSLIKKGDRIWIRDGFPLRGGEAASFSDLPTTGDPGAWEGTTGAFALCSFDSRLRALTLVRDPFGKRPVFYGEAEGVVAVASECKALQAVGFPMEIDPRPLSEALAYRWVIGEWHLFRACRQVPLGGIVTWAPGASFEAKSYWRPEFSPEPGDRGSIDLYCDLTDRALRKAIRSASRTYGRVGLFLSGGVDSSLLAALAAQEVESLDTFVGRIPGCDIREDKRAMKVADMLGIRCHVVDIDPARFPEDFGRMVRRMEEIPRHPNNLVVQQLYEAAEGMVDIMLEGDGTGTLWGHSNTKQTYLFEQKVRMAERIPRPLRRFLAGILEKAPSDLAWRMARVMAWDSHMYARTREALYYSRPVMDVLGLSLLNETAWESGEWNRENPIDDEGQAFMVRNLVRGGCVRHDRLSQPHGIAAFSPFMSSETWEVCQRIPREARMRDNLTKPVLRDLLDRYLPKEVGQWEKVGFEVPWPSWIRNEMVPLRAEADTFLRSTPLLPRNFWKVSNRVEDPEGIWTGLAFYLLHREFGLLEAET